ncbi:MAG: hypothetical protein RLZZ69_3216, partial [Cyanobacteriota bacterium]
SVGANSAELQTLRNMLAVLRKQLREHYAVGRRLHKILLGRPPASGVVTIDGILFDLETARRAIFAKSGKTPEFDLISKSIANLLRKWAQV